MKIFIIGGTGLLGSQAAHELISRGHEVTSLALPPLPEGATFDSKMKIVFGNYLELSDKQLKEMMSGFDGFIFAAGIDERVEAPAPIYELYKKYNIDPTDRLLRLAKECKIKHCVVLGSYFSYFAKKFPEMNLEEDHFYIKSRIEQEKVAMSYADKNFDVAVLELPYIFGVQPGRKPVWVFLVDMIRKMKGATFWCKGGTTMVTVKQVGQAVAGAMEKNRGGNCYPIGYYNMTWKEFLGICHKHLGYKNRKVIAVPNCFFKIACKVMKKKQIKAGFQGGLDLPKFVKLQCSNQFISKEEGCEKLGVLPDDIDSAIKDSVELSVAILDKKVQNIVTMKAN